MKINARKVGPYAVLGAVFAYAALSPHTYNLSSEAREGRSWLESTGHQEVRGGKKIVAPEYCGSDTARYFTYVSDADGRAYSRVLCFGEFGAYAPMPRQR